MRDKKLEQHQMIAISFPSFSLNFSKLRKFFLDLFFIEEFFSENPPDLKNI